jgi:hypothetical protein
MPHSAADETPRRGGTGQDVGQGGGGRGGAKLLCAARGWAMQGTAVGGDRGKPYAGRTTKRLTGGAGLQVGAGARERAAGRWGWLVSEREANCGAGWRARGGRPEMGRKRRRSAGARGKRPRVWARNRPSRGRETLFLFLFTFSTHFLFVSFSFCTKLFGGYSRCWKIKSK